MRNRSKIGAACVSLIVASAWFCATARGESGAPAIFQPSVGPLESVKAIAQRPEWNRFTILVWQYQTDARRDRSLYEKLGLRGFHIDRGAGQEEAAHWSRETGWPYYVDHAAGKGILYLNEGDRPAILRKKQVVIRPHSLADPATIAELEKRLRANISATRGGLVLAYAFDDEISLGTFTSPCEVDAHPRSVAWYGKWLEARYGTIEKLNRQWGSRFTSFGEIAPAGFESVRAKATAPPIAAWNLSPWMDFRQFMDYQFATILRHLTQYANSLDPSIPAGFVGGQQPAVYGGYDYALLTRAVQWMEAYDIGGTNEILRSLWNQPHRPHVQTFFSAGDPRQDSWFLWYYATHGNPAVIAWPEKWFRQGGNEIAPSIAADAATFRDVQSSATAPLIAPDARFDPDPIGVYYSHPSVQVGWAMDCIPHGGSWVNRSSSLDGECQTQAHVRLAWFKLLEDCGFQYDVISYLDVLEGKADLEKRFKVIILPRTIALSDIEAAALKRFVEAGGTLIADAMCGLTDEHGRGRPTGALDDLFAIRRDETKGYFNGKELAEINGELYNKPLLERLTAYQGATRWNGLVVVEPGTRLTSDARPFPLIGESGLPANAFLRNSAGQGGRTVYLNLSPLEYLDPSRRTADSGKSWRQVLGVLMEIGNLNPRLVVGEGSQWPSPMIESLWWRRGNERYLAIVKNPVRKATVSSFGKIEGDTLAAKSITLSFRDRVARLENLRTGKNLGSGRQFTDSFNPCQANTYSVSFEERRAP